MKVTLDLSELEWRAVMNALWRTNTERCWQAISSWRMWLADCPAQFEDKIDDMQFAFLKVVLNKVRNQMKNQGLNTDERYALIYDEEIPEVKNFLITNKIKPLCWEHEKWVK